MLVEQARADNDRRNKLARSGTDMNARINAEAVSSQADKRKPSPVPVEGDGSDAPSSKKQAIEGEQDSGKVSPFPEFGQVTEFSNIDLQTRVPKC